MTAITLRFLATPADTAAGGRSVAAGSVMEWIDKAGYACAVGWCGRVLRHRVRRQRPAPPADPARQSHRGPGAASCTPAAPACTWWSRSPSAEVSTRAYTPATTCVLIFVAKDADGRPTPVPAWTPASRSDRKLAEAAIERIDRAGRDQAAHARRGVHRRADGPRVTLRFLVPPGVVNCGGKAHGGTVMRWIDEAAYACAAAWVRAGDRESDAIAVYSGGIHFLAPVRIGDLVEVDARLIFTGPHSMHVSTRVSTADPRTPASSSPSRPSA